MDLDFSKEDEEFRSEFRSWIDQELSGEFSTVRGRGGPGDEQSLFEERCAWERHLGKSGWTCAAWPTEFGGRGLSFSQQVIYFEEYARAGGPGRVNHVGETLLGPTLIMFGTEAQQKEFLPGIVSGEQLWCQGYSEPNAGSDLANVQTRARLEGDQWILDGQKVWTSGGAFADWCFVMCRTEPDAKNHAALSCLLVPMRQEGIEARPIIQMTGTSEFCEVFFDGARTEARHIVGDRGDGWRVAMGTLAIERGASTLGQQAHFENELSQIIEIARKNGKADDPVMRQRLADAWIGLRVMRANALRCLSAEENAAPGPESMITKIYWATWHRDLGKLAMDVIGAEAELAEKAPYELSMLQQMYLFTRSDTIYAGTNQIQRNIISERALGLPREPRGTK